MSMSLGPLLPLLLVLCCLVGQSPSAGLEPAVRVVRFQVQYPDAELDSVRKMPNWAAVMRKSVLASLRFVNKHWLICGEVKEKAAGASSSGSDCGKLQVSGEEVSGRGGYRINATFIANRDPVKNAKVDANSSVLSVLQIGLKGGIFQYTNAMKVLNKPSADMSFEEAYFCYPGQELADREQCRKSDGAEKANTDS